MSVDKFKYSLKVESILSLKYLFIEIRVTLEQKNSRILTNTFNCYLAINLQNKL